jgi:hypothetical protein
MTNFQLVIQKFELISFAEIKKEQKKTKDFIFPFYFLLYVLIIESHSEGKQK